MVRLFEERRHFADHASARLDEGAFYDGLMLGVVGRGNRDEILFEILNGRKGYRNALPLLLQNAVRHLLIIGDLGLLDKLAHTKPFDGFMNRRTLNPVIESLFSALC
jgi:hypothetical protein